MPPALTDLNDLVTHREAWQKAIIECLNRARKELRVDDAQYWQHELDAFNRTFKPFRSIGI